VEPNQCIATNVYSLRPAYMALGVVCLAFMSDLASGALQAAPDLKVQAQSNYGKLPLSFEINQGQTDAQVKFLARGQGYTLFLTPTEAVLSLKKPQARTKASPTSVKPSFVSEIKEAVLRMQFVGANPAPRVLGKEALPGRINYLIGNDPGKWHTQVPTYAKVAYESVYPGVGLVYYGNQGQLEYDFVMAPGADPSRVKLAFRGANRIDVNRAGELVLHTASGDIRMHKPVLYQEIDGVRKPVDGGYVLKDGQTVGFQVATYDATHSLTIDPVLVYSTYLGGGEAYGNDSGNGIAVDQKGQAYVVGSTGSSDFPIVNALQPSFNRDSDAFIAKFTADGSALLYSTYFGGGLLDFGKSIAVDQKGQAYMTGSTEGGIPIVNAVQPTMVYPAIYFVDAFVAQLSADGSALLYSTYLGGNDFDEGLGIAVDERGQAYVTGTTASSDFPAKNALQPNSGGVGDAFVAQLSDDGRALRYSTYLGGSGHEVGGGIDVDKHGQASVIGTTTSSDFPAKNALQSTFGGGGEDAFVAQLTADGKALRYSTYLGGSGREAGSGIAVDKKGQAYVTGNTGSSDFPTKNALQPTFRGGFIDAFVAKFTADGRALAYSTYLGGEQFDSGRDIAVDQHGQAYVTGSTNSGAFPVKNALQPENAGYSDAFVAKFTADGKALRYSTYLGGGSSSMLNPPNDYGRAIAVDQWGQAYVTGITNTTDFPTHNALQSTYGGDPTDAFVAKIGSDDRRCELKKKCKNNHEDDD
jgi:hypothetical protein